MKQKKSTYTIFDCGKTCVLLAIFMVACAPRIKVTSDYDRFIDFSNYQTFKLAQQTTMGQVNSLNRDRITNSIHDEMDKKGFVQSDIEPDLIIHAVTVVKNKRALSVNSNAVGHSRFYGPHGFWGTPTNGHATVRSNDYKEGTLVIEILDAKTRKLIWTGTANSELNKKPKNPDEAIRTAVAKVLTTFPYCSFKTEREDLTGRAIWH
jgi:hypothetical protein